jgi:uncharacterized RDD family membrane protein YckC
MKGYRMAILTCKDCAFTATENWRMGAHFHETGHRWDGQHSPSHVREYDLLDPASHSGNDGPSGERMGFWIRTCAALIDGVIFMVGFMVLAVLLGESASFFVAILLAALHHVILTSIRGQTLGKMALGIQVVKASGDVPGIWTSLLREIVGKFLSIAFFFPLGFLWVGWNRNKRGWDDLIGGTYVIRKRLGSE